MRRTTIIITVSVLALALVFFIVQAKKKDTSLVDSIFDAFRKKKPEREKPAFVGDTSKATTNKEWLQDALGLGDIFMDRFTEKDAGIARHYIENYMRKGVAMKQTDPLFNDVTRIAQYSNIFKKP